MNSEKKGIERRDAIKLGALTALGAIGASALSGCAPSQKSEDASEGIMAPGTYVGTALGHKGLWELPVTVKVSDSAILEISVPENRFEHGETTPVLNSVRDKMFPRIIASQSLEVDAITGATVSSMTCKTAIENALIQAIEAAGNDASLVSKFHDPVEKEELGVTEETTVDVLLIGLSIGGCFALRRTVEEMQAINGNNKVSVMAIDRAGKIGGRSCFTHMIQSVNPQYGIDANGGKNMVDPEDYYKLWEYWITEDGKPEANLDVIRMFIENSGETLDWQIARGWRIGGSDPEGPQEGTVSYHTVPAPGHQEGTFEDRRILVDGLMKQFTSFATAQGARIELETEAYEFLYDSAENRVIGVKARNLATGKEYVINANAVLMGTGGFGCNDELMEKYHGGAYPFLGPRLDTGLMIKAAIELGAGTRNIEMAPLIMHIGLPHFLTKYPIEVDKTSLNNFTGRYSTYTLNDVPLGLGLSGQQLAVGPDGKRFANENTLMMLFSTDVKVSSWPSFKCGHHYYSIWSEQMLKKVGKEGLNNVARWEVYQSQGGYPAETPIPEILEIVQACIDEGMAWKGDTVESLAEAVGLDAGTLKDTVDSYNAYCSSGTDEQYAKDAAYLEPLDGGPFYAIQLDNVIFATCGGLSVDDQVRVCQADNKTPINGLYAYGCDSLGNLLNPRQNYTVFPAIAAGWNQTGGRMAAINAVKYVNENFGLTEVPYQLLPEDMQ